MGKQHSFVKLSGRVGDISLMQTRNGFRARQATGIDGRRIKNDPSFLRTRWAMAEFTEVAKASSLIQQAIQYSTSQVKDPLFRRRLSSLLHKIKVLDVTNLLGSRKIAEGVQHPDASWLLKQIDVNSDNPLPMVCSSIRYQIDRTTGIISFKNFKPSTDVLKALNCHKLGFNSLWVNIDFEGKTYNAKFATEVMIDPNDQLQDITLSIPELPSGNGMNFVFLKILNYYENTDGSAFLGQELGYNSFGLVDAYLP